MPMPTRSLSYGCSKCQKRKSYPLDLEIHQALLSDSSNGLVLYSALHTCDDNLISINNLEIDHNLDIRSVKLLKLPSDRVYDKEETKLNLPSPTERKQVHLLEVTNLPRVDLRLILRDSLMNVDIKIGSINTKNEKPIRILPSPQAAIQIDLYRSIVPYSAELEAWLLGLLTLLQELPPTKLGLLIEVFYIITKFNNQPYDSFNEILLRTVLNAHLSRVEIKERQYFQQFMENKVFFSEDDLKLMLKMLQDIVSSPGLHLLEYIAISDQELSHVVPLLLILENHQLISIHRSNTESTIFDQLYPEPFDPNQPSLRYDPDCLNCKTFGEPSPLCVMLHKR